MITLGIETSCDETGVALYSQCDGLLAESLYSQIDLHRQYGGVVPEIASRDHVNKLLPLVQSVLKHAGLDMSEVNSFAYTRGPGLKGALLTGASFAHGIAYAMSRPVIGVHHMEGHLLANKLGEQDLQFPFVGLLVSGGHTLLIDAKSPGEYIVLGDTLDDAVGEAFDKTAKMMRLPYPGGPVIADYAKRGISARFCFPRPMTNRPGLDFSFSGLKTHALTVMKQCMEVSDQRLTEQDIADIACAFQAAVVDTLMIKCKRALEKTQYKRLVVAGGVGSNAALREKLSQLMSQREGQVLYPDSQWCTDNGAMIALAGNARLCAGQKDMIGLIDVMPRWDLECLTRFDF